MCIRDRSENAGYLFKAGGGCIGFWTGVYHLMVLVAVGLAIASNLVRFFFLSFPLALLLDKFAGDPLRDYMLNHNEGLNHNTSVLLLFIVPLICFASFMLFKYIGAQWGGRGVCFSIEKSSTVLLAVVSSFIVIFAVVVVSLLLYELDSRHFFIILSYLVVFLIIIFHVSHSMSHLPLFAIPFAILLLVATTTRWRIMHDSSWLLGQYSGDRFAMYYYIAVGGLILFTIPGHPLSYSKVVSLVGRLFRQRLYRAFFFNGTDIDMSQGTEGITFEDKDAPPGVRVYGTTQSQTRLHQPVFLTNAVAHSYRNPDVLTLDEDKRDYFSFVFSQVSAGSYRTGYLPITKKNRSLLGLCYPTAQVTASYAMTSSAAALAVHNGDYDQQGLSAFIFTLFNIGLGDWFEFHTLSHHGRLGYTLCIAFHIIVLLMLLFAQIFNVDALLYVGYSLILLLLLSVFTKLGAVSLYSFPVRQVQQSLGAVWEHRQPPPLLYLSDGGHIENLGLVELLRRCCKHIMVCDAMAESEDWHPFCMLHTAMEKARSGIRSAIQSLPAHMTQLDVNDDSYEDRSRLHVIRCSFQPPPEVDDKVDVEQYLEAMLDAPYVKIHVSYHTDLGRLLGTGVIHYVRLQGIRQLTEQVNSLPGICCECCHDLPWTKMFGEFPKHSTASQFFTPRIFNAYADSGKDAIAEAVRQLMKGTDEDSAEKKV
eukprot:TRINITY_DN17045_c0_g1_i2.p1 TRINITY_DN17045_c0_g1~~TRINITY_DN17045_c0_g1_i2.p1  ORF type:complete len:703 (+),score=124.72 TRINITY_DN17045_c0_g1_i2:112-2220(+)